MLAILSRVRHATCNVDDAVVGRCDRGLLVYVGVVAGDTEADADWLAAKLIDLRVFADDAGRMNRSLADIGGSVLLIPNFTLAGRTRKGTRPSFTDAAQPELAQQLFKALAARCAARISTQTGRFAAHMRITSEADGPVTLTLNSR